jgi:hypothetical protein
MNTLATYRRIPLHTKPTVDTGPACASRNCVTFYRQRFLRKIKAFMLIYSICPMKL